MYTIKCGSALIYSPTLHMEKYDVLDPTITSELNQVDKLSFVAPDTNPNYNVLKPLKDIITVFNDNDLVFKGRILAPSRDFYRKKSVVAEGVFGFLRDVVLRNYGFVGMVPYYLRYLLHKYNLGVSEDKRIGKYVGGDEEANLIYGTCTFTDTIVRASTEYPTVFDEINEKLLKPLGGYLLFRYENEGTAANPNWITYVDYLKTITEIGTQKVRFADNLLDLNDQTNIDELYTVIIPLGKKNENTGGYLTIESVNSGLDYIEDATAVALYGRIEKTVIWDDETDAQDLYDKGAARLAVDSQHTFTVEAKALDMRDLGGSADAFVLGKKYKVISAPHGYTDAAENNQFILSRIVRKLQEPQRSEFTFGTVKKMSSQILSKTL